MQIVYINIIFLKLIYFTYKVEAGDLQQQSVFSLF